MNLRASTIYEILQAKRVEYLYHANSVVTACQFLRYGGLLSRGQVERKGLTQTSQTSDALDKRYGLWYDVFMDTVDIHQRARNVNFYGPVLFVIKAEILTELPKGSIWITKLNPTKWQGKTEEERWFTNKSDLETNFVNGRFDQMIVIKDSGGELPLEDYVDRIILDDPGFFKMPGEIDYFSMAVGALRFAMEDSNLNVEIHRRKCSQVCDCEDYWDKNRLRLPKMFDPKQ